MFEHFALPRLTFCTILLSRNIFWKQLDKLSQDRKGNADITVLTGHIFSTFVTFYLTKNDDISESAFLVFPSFFGRGDQNLTFLKKITGILFDFN